MPPGPAFNWICVAHSALDILNHAARYRAAQLSSPLTSQSVRKQQRVNDHVSEESHERNNEEELEKVVEIEAGECGTCMHMHSTRHLLWYTSVIGSTRTNTQQAGFLNDKIEPVSSMNIDYPKTEAGRVQADSHFVRPDSLRHANEAWISQISISPFPILPNSPIEPVIETTAQPAQPGLTPAKLQETAVPSAPPPALQSSPSPSVADPNLSLAIDAEHIILSSDVCPIVCTFRTSVSFILSRLIHIRFILKGIDY